MDARRRSFLRRGVLQLQQGVPRAIKNGEDTQKDHRKKQIRNRSIDRHSKPQQKSHRSKKKCAVTFSQWTIVTPRSADLHANYAGHFSQNRENHNAHHEPRIESRHNSQWEIQSHVRDDVPEFIQYRAQRALLVVLARQHSIHRIERHAQEQNDGQQQQRWSTMRPCDHVAGAERKQQRRNRHSIRGHADSRQPIHDRPQQALKRRLQLINAWHCLLGKLVGTCEFGKRFLRCEWIQPIDKSVRENQRQTTIFVMISLPAAYCFNSVPSLCVQRSRFSAPPNETITARTSFVAAVTIVRSESLVALPCGPTVSEKSGNPPDSNRTCRCLCTFLRIFPREKRFLPQRVPGHTIPPAIGSPPKQD